MEIENLIRYTALAVGLKPSAMQGEARRRRLFPTKRHPCWPVVSVPIRVLFRLLGRSPPARGRRCRRADGLWI